MNKCNLQNCRQCAYNNKPEYKRLKESMVSSIFWSRFNSRIFYNYNSSLYPSDKIIMINENNIDNTLGKMGVSIVVIAFILAFILL